MLLIISCPAYNQAKEYGANPTRKFPLPAAVEFLQTFKPKDDETVSIRLSISPDLLLRGRGFSTERDRFIDGGTPHQLLSSRCPLAPTSSALSYVHCPQLTPSNLSGLVASSLESVVRSFIWFKCDTGFHVCHRPLSPLDFTHSPHSCAL